MFDLKGKRALVTGSTQGIGEAIARLLAKQGAFVYINCSSSAEKCENIAASIRAEGGEAAGVCCDLSKDGCADQLYSATGELDILVLNASVQFRRKWSEIPSDEFDKVIRVNFKSSLEIIQKYAPGMCERKYGRIVTVGSVQQSKPHKDMLVYAASKEAGMSMVKNLAKQLAPFGVTINNLSPGVIATPRNEAALADPEYSKLVYAGIPAGYAGLSEDMAPSALLLCSDEGRYITGTDLVVDGGMHL